MSPAIWKLVHIEASVDNPGVGDRNTSLDQYRTGSSTDAHGLRQLQGGLLAISLPQLGERNVSQCPLD
jgi:hypothetical protein